MTGIKLIEKCSAGASSSILLDPDPSPPPSLSEILQQRNGAKKPSSAFSRTAGIPILKLPTTQVPTYSGQLLTTFEHKPSLWRTHHHSTYRLYNLSALVLKHGFFCLGSGA